jgi:putative hydrolase of the HAD superfamily
MKTIKAIFFDYDGVMTIDKTGTQSICNYISENYCIDKNIFEKEYRKYNNDLLYGKTTPEKIWNELCSNLNERIPYSILYDSFVNTPIDIEMHNLAKKIKEKGVKTGLITDNKMDRIKIIAEKYELDKIFNVIKISAEIGSGKDNEDIFRIALNEIECKPYECVFIDNQERNLIIPKKMGIKTIFYDDEKRDINGLKKEMEEYGIIV